jgi:hypothetical protein
MLALLRIFLSAEVAQAEETGEPRDELRPRERDLLRSPGARLTSVPGSATYFGSGASGVFVKNDQMICEALGVFPTGGGKLWPPVL